MAYTSFKIMTSIGLLFLLHAGYSATQYRRFMRITEQEHASLPVDILVQSMLGLLISMVGVVHFVGNLKEIRATKQLENQTWDNAGNRPSFFSFSHRGRNLSCANAMLDDFSER